MAKKTGGVKKKKGGGSKDKGAKTKIHVPTESDRRLPPITDVKCATLQATIIMGDPTSFDRLVGHYNHASSLPTVDANGSSLIHICVKKRDFSMLRTILSHNKIDLNITESPTVGGHTALFVACATNFPQAVDILLKAGANPDVKSNNLNGETALMICCKNGFMECARLLLEGGASVDIRDNFGNNASFWAYTHQQQQMIRDLNLPPMHTPDADQFLKLLIERNPKFTLPIIKPKEKKGDKKGDKKDGKGKKKK
jgi:hypothetical protein